MKMMRRMMQMRAAETDDEDKMIVEGYAAVFNSKTTIWESSWSGYKYTEQIAEGAFDGAEMSRTVFKYNHGDNGLVLARDTAESEARAGVDVLHEEPVCILMDRDPARGLGAKRPDEGQVHADERQIYLHAFQEGDGGVQVRVGERAGRLRIEVDLVHAHVLFAFLVDQGGTSQVLQHELEDGRIRLENDGEVRY